MGPPGAGKGTQSEILEERLQLVHVSSGDLLRDHRRRGTDLGKTAEEYMVNGKLVPDDLVIEMIIERLARPDVEHGILLDGFPRTLPQAEALGKALDMRGKLVNCVLYIKASREVLLDRLSGRWTCPNGHIFHEKFAPPKVAGVCDDCGAQLYQRDDDKRETAIKRLQEFEKATLPIVEYYRERRILCELNGDQSVEKVTNEMLECLR
jgi:adenylate kinase